LQRQKRRPANGDLNNGVCVYSHAHVSASVYMYVLGFSQNILNAGMEMWVVDGGWGGKAERYAYNNQENRVVGIFYKHFANVGACLTYVF